MDESDHPSTEPASVEDAGHRKTVWKLALLTREGAEFVIAVPPKNQGAVESLGTQSQNAEPAANWTRHAAEVARRLGEKIEAGPLLHIFGHNVERHVVVMNRGEKSFLVAWPPETASASLMEKSKKLVASWDS